MKMRLQEYKNRFSNREYAQFNIIFNIELEKVMNNYVEYIKDKEKVVEIFKKIKSLQYVNAGYVNWEEWKHNKHIFIINGQAFEYKTGCGINVNESLKVYPDGRTASYENAKYDFTKLLFNAIYCLLNEANMVYCYSEDDFIEEMGYTESVKKYKEGIANYQLMKENKRKLEFIFGNKSISELQDIMQL